MHAAPASSGIQIKNVTCAAHQRGRVSGMAAAVNWKRVPCGSSVDEGLLFFYYLILRMRLFLPFLTVSRSVKHGSFHVRRTPPFGNDFRFRTGKWS